MRYQSITQLLTKDALRWRNVDEIIGVLGQLFGNLVKINW